MSASESSKQDEQQALNQYLEEKAKQGQEKLQQEAEALSEYETCVLRESARVRELMAEAWENTGDGSEDK